MRTTYVKAMIACAAVMMSSCTSHDMFDEGAIENDLKKSYAENFMAKFPNVNINQNWDYSTKQSSYGLVSNNGGKKAVTRAGENPWSIGDWYEVEQGTLDWMFSRLTENQSHKDLGKPFYMITPETDFTIVPICQGGAYAVYELHVVIEGMGDYTIWGKTGNIEIIDDFDDNRNWTPLSEAWHRDSKAGQRDEMVYSTLGGGRQKHDGSNVKVTNVRSREIKFSGIPAGRDMHFYLKITRGVPNYCNTGAEQSSLNNMMVALTDAEIPGNLAGKEAMIIGCEDSDQGGSDWDYNDVVFLVYGDKRPTPVIVTGEKVTESKTVRYMIEDLGATDDFDFNDIVVDVTETTEKTPVLENGNFKEWTDVRTYQKAKIRHLGGTLPFIIKIGNTELAEMGGQSTFKTDPDLEFDVEGWNINTHNINVKVQQGSNEGVYNNVRFPKAGEAPMIIAVDPNLNWMNERVCVPEDWFYIPE